MPLTDTLRSRATVRSAARRALGVLVAGGLATTLGWTALTAPEAQAAGTVEVTGITTRTLHGDDPTTVQAWQRIDITANWTDKNPTAGDTISLALGEGLRWPGGVDFQLTKKGDENVKIGDCAVHEADKTLICTLNDTVEQWESIDDGELTIHAQMTDKMVGKTQTTVTVNGTDFTVIPGDDNNDGTCDISCDGVIPKKADPNSFKIGWLSRVNEDGSYVWTWEVNVSGATSYTVVDQGGDYRYMECTDTDWSQRWRPNDAAYNEETRTVTWTTASTSTVCHVLYTSSSTEGSASNEAVVNDSATTLTATATADAFGEGYGNGSKATPTPTPTTEAPTAPATETPTVPATDEPTAPATDEPTAPATDEPTAPATDEPTAPATETPTAPATDEPTAPATDEPTAPATDEPTAPATDEPTAPATDEPTAPATDEPTAPATETPAPPATETPTATAAPAVPGGAGTTEPPAGSDRAANPPADGGNGNGGAAANPPAGNGGAANPPADGGNGNGGAAANPPAGNGAANPPAGNGAANNPPAAAGPATVAATARPGSSGLAHTGTAAGVIAVVALILVGAGVFAVRRRRAS